MVRTRAATVWLNERLTRSCTSSWIVLLTFQSLADSSSGMIWNSALILCNAPLDASTSCKRQQWERDNRNVVSVKFADGKSYAAQSVTKLSVSSGEIQTCKNLQRSRRTYTATHHGNIHSEIAKC